MERNAKIIESLIGEDNSVKMTAAKFNVQRSFVIRLVLECKRLKIRLPTAAPLQ